jgi:Pretoxin HINT domain/LysM domain
LDIPKLLQSRAGQSLAEPDRAGFVQSSIYSYDWYDGAVKTGAIVTGTGQQAAGTSTYSLDAFGQIVSSVTTGSPSRTQSFRYDAAGQGIERRETINGGTWSNSWTDQWYRMGGTNMWHLSNRYDPRIGAGDPGARYTVRNGDTLASIAQGLWGDASLWYKLAEANGLAANASLTEGQSLSVPAGVWRSQQTAKTYIPYDAQKFLSLQDPSPTYPAPAPAKADNGCGVIGKILLVVIAVVVAIYAPTVLPFIKAAALGGGVAGTVASGAISAAIGSTVSQAVGVATGIQDKFSFKDVALAAIAGGVGAGVGSIGGLSKATSLFGKIQQGFARGVIGNVVTQGVSIATGLQTKFDWAGVAVGGVVGGVSAGVGAALKIAPLVGEGASRSIGNVAGNAATGMAAAIAGAATRSLITGTDFGDNIAATLPDVIGSTIGNLVAGGISGKSAPRPGKDAGNGKTTSKTPGSDIVVNADAIKFNWPALLPDVTTAAQAKAMVQAVSGGGGTPKPKPAPDTAPPGATADDIPEIVVTADRRLTTLLSRSVMSNTGFGLYALAAARLDAQRDAVFDQTGIVVSTLDAKRTMAASYASLGGLSGVALGFEKGRQIAYTKLGFQIPNAIEASLNLATQVATTKGQIDVLSQAVRNPTAVIQPFVGWRDATVLDSVVIASNFAPGAGRVVSRATTFTLERGIPLIGRALADTRGVLTIGRVGERGGGRTIAEFGACFVAGTLVHTPDGLKPIEQLRSGDLVLSQPEMGGEHAIRPIVKTVSFDDKAIWQITYVNAEGQAEAIHATDNHPFWVEDIGWTAAELLEAGQSLQLADGNTATVISAFDTGTVDQVFNFEVDGFHTYYVGQQGVWVHNTNCAAPVDGLIYKRIDTTGRIEDYIGKTTEGNRLAREATHRRAFPDSRFDFEIVERGIARGDPLSIAEHNVIQDLTGGVAVRHSSVLSNQRDAVGAGRRLRFGLPEPK